jgi:hypothetical protein
VAAACVVIGTAGEEEAGAEEDEAGAGDDVGGAGLELGGGTTTDEEAGGTTTDEEAGGTTTAGVVVVVAEELATSTELEVAGCTGPSLLVVVSWGGGSLYSTGQAEALIPPIWTKLQSLYNG